MADKTEYKAVPKISKDIDLKPLDVVSYVGKKGNFFHGLTRFMEGGMPAVKDRDVPIHTGIVVPYKGKLMIAEMKIKDNINGLSINPIEKDQAFIKGVTRFKLNANERNKITKNIIHDYENENIKYPKVSGPLNFFFKKKEKKDLKAAICSEYVARKIEEGSRYDVVKSWHKVVPTDLALMDGIEINKPKEKPIRGSKIEYIPIEMLKKKLEKVSHLFMR